MPTLRARLLRAVPVAGLLLGLSAGPAGALVTPSPAPPGIVVNSVQPAPSPSAPTPTQTPTAASTVVDRPTDPVTRTLQLAVGGAVALGLLGLLGLYLTRERS